MSGTEGAMSLAFDACLRGLRAGLRSRPLGRSAKVGAWAGIAVGLAICLMLALT